MLTYMPVNFSNPEDPVNDWVKEIALSAAKKALESIPLVRGESEDQLLSPSQAAKLFSPAPSMKTLRKWARLKNWQVRQHGTKMFFLKSEVLAHTDSLKKYQRIQ